MRKEARLSLVVGNAVWEVVVVGDVCGAELREMLGQGVEPQGGGDVLAAEVAPVHLSPGEGWRHVAWRPEDVPPQPSARPVVARGCGVPHGASRNLP